VRLKKMRPGIIVYDVCGTKMGNTTISTVSVYQVEIVSVDFDRNTVNAKWNHNRERTYYYGSWKKWRAKKPILVETAFGAYRMATRQEIADMAQRQSEATP